MLKNTLNRYGFIARLLHWGCAISIISLFILGLWMVELDYTSSWYLTAPHIHESVGILLFFVMAFRVIWRRLNLQPLSENTLKPWEKKVAHFTHIIIYLIIFSILITGYLIPTADNRGIDVFNWFTVPASGALFEQQEDIAGQWHCWLAYSLAVLIILHVRAALKHHFIEKDNTLKKML